MRLLKPSKDQYRLLLKQGRVTMSRYIKSLIANKYKLYYMDTDSLIIDQPLPESMVSDTMLGKFKLEHVIKEGVFLAPKVYGLKLQDGSEIIKVKGLSSKAGLTFDALKSLLHMNSSITLNQDKSFRNFSDSTINLVKQTYELIPTENKRQILYDINGLMIGTKPYVITPDRTITTTTPNSNTPYEEEDE